ncbi:MAG: hypothetical protein JF626_08555 [Polaromonas sp.]|nr:hypothetical protein [Polaromonas sp.]
MLGLPTNRRLLSACLTHPVFRAGQALIPFLAEQGEAIRELLQKEEREVQVDTGLAVLFVHNFGSGLPCPFPRPFRLRHRDKPLDLHLRELGRGELALDVGGEMLRAAVQPQADGAVIVRTGAAQRPPSMRPRMRWWRRCWQKRAGKRALGRCC